MTTFDGFLGCWVDGEGDPVPQCDRLQEHPDPTRTWVHSDGCLYAEPPYPVARVSYDEAGYTLPIFGGVSWWPVVEAPACGAVRDVPAEQTLDGQRRRYMCDRPAGHIDKRPGPEEHRCVTWDLTPTGGAHTVVWPADGRSIERSKP